MMTSIESEEEMIEYGYNLGKILEPGAIILLNGDLGAGKTTMAKGIAAGLGIKKKINSPTFVVMKVYDNPEGIGLVHVDAYRLSDYSELRGIGFEEYLNENGYVGVVEWSQNIDRKWPKGTRVINLRAGSHQFSRDVLLEVV